MSVETIVYDDAATFFDAWMRGVELAGWRWFGDGARPSEWPTRKNQVQPRYDEIVRALGWLSSGEAAFLVAMYSFYNAYAAKEMWESVNLHPMSSLASCLDEPRRRVIADLLVSYEGW